MPLIDEIWAWTQIDAEGDEGIVGYQPAGSDTFMPLVGADKDRMVSLRPTAQMIADLSGRPVRLRRFSQVTDMDELQPRRPERN